MNLELQDHQLLHAAMSFQELELSQVNFKNFNFFSKFNLTFNLSLTFKEPETASIDKFLSEHPGIFDAYLDVS